MSKSDCQNSKAFRLGCFFCERIKDGIIKSNDVPIEEELVSSPEKHLSIKPIRKVFPSTSKSHGGRTITSSHWFEEKGSLRSKSIRSFFYFVER